MIWLEPYERKILAAFGIAASVTGGGLALLSSEYEFWALAVCIGVPTMRAKRTRIWVTVLGRGSEHSV